MYRLCNLHTVPSYDVDYHQLWFISLK